MRRVSFAVLLIGGGLIAFPPLLWLINALVSVLVHFFVFSIRILPQPFALILGIVCLLAAFAGVILVAAHKDDNTLPQPAASAPRVIAAPLDAAAKTRIAKDFGNLPLSFEINKGQIDESVKFLARGSGYDLFLTATGATLRVQKPRSLQVAKLKEALPAKTDPDTNVREGTVLRLKMLGANATPQVEGQEELPGKVNYFRGNDPAKWRPNIPTYRRAYFKDVYSGIDLVYYGKQRELEYDFVVAAGANPKLIRFTVEGADQVRLDKAGRLQLGLKFGEVTLNKPVIYQLDENGSRREVKGMYVINGNEVKFKLERFDSSKPLIIDPVLSYSTLLGSSGNDNAVGIAVDSQGSAYVTGTTESTTFPTTPGAFKTTVNRGAAFVTKLDPAGSTLVYSTYLSGSGTSFGTTNGLGIAVDSAGNAHITGTTNTPDFPIANGLKTTSNFFKTTDAAANWNNQNAGLVGDVNLLAVAPNAANTIYASSTDGIYRSTDGGVTWAATVAREFSDLEMKTSNGDAIVAMRYNDATKMYELWKSLDAGATFSVRTTGWVNNIGSSNGGRLAVTPTNPNRVYAVLLTDSGPRILRSDDFGDTWRVTASGGPVHHMAMIVRCPHHWTSPVRRSDERE